eukprot:SAG31_NODE_24392_length_482_cov_1.101828_1_plen_37_part_10
MIAPLETLASGAQQQFERPVEIHSSDPYACLGVSYTA